MINERWSIVIPYCSRRRLPVLMIVSRRNVAMPISSNIGHDTSNGRMSIRNRLLLTLAAEIDEIIVVCFKALIKCVLLIIKISIMAIENVKNECRPKRRIFLSANNIYNISWNRYSIVQKVVKSPAKSIENACINISKHRWVFIEAPDWI